MTDKLYHLQDTVQNLGQIDKALFLKTACNDEDDLNSLLAYYRDRINDFEQERNEWLYKLEEVRLTQDVKHRQDWELQKRKEEITELQKTITEQKIVLFDERQQVLKFQRDNDQMRIKEIEDRRKIAELLSLTDPVEEDIVLNKDIRPEITSKYVRNDLNIHRNKENADKAIKNLGISRKQINSGSGKSIVKTIYLPNENLNTLALENENLKKQLDQERNLHLSSFTTLKEQLEIKNEELERKDNYDTENHETLLKKYQKMERQHLDLNKEYFALRQKCNEAERKMNEENELLRLRNTAVTNKLMVIQKSSKVDIDVTKELANKRSEEYTNKFRDQVKVKEEELSVIKNQYNQATRIYMDKVRLLESNLSKLAEKYHILEKRRTLEVSGFKSEIKILQKRFETKDEKQATQACLRKPEKTENVKKEEEEEKQATMKATLKATKKKKKEETKKIYKETFPTKPKQKSHFEKQQKQEQEQEELVQQPYYEENYEKEDNYDDREELIREEQKSRSETVDIEELDEIKLQLEDLEKQLDMAKKQ